ncbi:MAG TPA: amidohydrolase family protein [Candidatus Aminicenantes bacterium]|nr:amidohydrolase family protein [Candidatus Aminicenantes bacterium]
MKKVGFAGSSVKAAVALPVFLCALCSFGGARRPGAPAGAAPKSEADLVILGAKVVTVDARFTVAEAVAVKDGLIAAVGAAKDVEKWVGPKTRTLDLAGKTVLPGINDTHLHFQWLATGKSSPVLSMGGPGPRTTRDEDRKALIAAMRELNARGITSVTDPGLSEDYVGIYRELRRDGLMTVRMNVLWCFSQRVENDRRKILDGLAAAGPRAGRDDPWLRVSGLKLGADNLPNDKSAWMRDGYTTGGNGRIHYPGATDAERAEAMTALILEAHRLGYQVGVHATGDRAIETLIEAFARAEGTDPKGLRHYIIHGDFTPLDGGLVKLMVKHGIGLSVQPGLAMIVGQSMGVNIEPERMARYAPFKALVAAGVHVAGGSDAPIVDPDWKQGVQSALTRRPGPGARFFGSTVPDKALGPDQALTLEEALRMYTIEGAWLDGMEKVKGSIEPGKLADLCVLDGDILTVETGKIKDIPTLLTVVGGKIVYNAKPDLLAARPGPM